MSTIALTIAIAFVVVLLAIGALAISWLLTGKTNLRPGACGRDPNKKKDDENCGTKSSSCSLCEKPDKACEPEKK